MYGIDTLIVRHKGKLVVHQCSIGMSLHMDEDSRKKKKTTAYKVLAKAIKKWGKPEARITAKEADKILNSHSSRKEDEGKPIYHRFACDGLYLLDLDGRTLFQRTGNGLNVKPVFARYDK